MICSKSRIDAESKKVSDIFLRNEYQDNVILSGIGSTISKCNSIESIGSSKCSVYMRIPWIGAVSLYFADKISGSVIRYLKIWMDTTTTPSQVVLDQSQVKSYQSNIRYVSRVKWSNPGKGVTPSPTPQCSSYWKGSFLVSLNYGHQLY